MPFRLFVLQGVYAGFDTFHCATMEVAVLVCHVVCCASIQLAC
jgi:hypothetical protein